MNLSGATPLATAAAGDDVVSRLERQVERGSLFTHTALSDLADRLTDVEALLHGLINALVVTGRVAEAAVTDAGACARDALIEEAAAPSPRVALRVDGQSTIQPSVVDCADRLPICGAACCRLSFALSPDEVETGTVKWDLGAPYHIRQEADGYCTHCSVSDRSCSIYNDRPGVCRTYDCTNDTRIWTDFAARKLNHDWIDRHLGPTRPRLARVEMRRSD